MADEQKNKSSGAVWDRLNQQSDLIGELARNQAALEANVAALAESVRSGFDQINANLVRHNQPTNWFAVISALVVVGGAILTFNALQTDPVRMRAMENAGKVDAVLERELMYAEMHGEVKARLQILTTEIHELQQFERDAAFIHGQREALEKKVQEMDLYGSRKWIEANGKN